ncbi:MAG: hypothetical protein WBM44_07190 [Waterburya sp.]
MEKRIDKFNRPNFWLPEEASCQRCASYISYRGASGWCNIFNRPAKETHSMTGDCQLNGAITLAPLPEEDIERSPYCVGESIKVIETEIHHTQWQEYQVAEVMKNEELYLSSENYLNQARWYFRIQTKHGRQLWLAENQICLAQESNLISTEEIF